MRPPEPSRTTVNGVTLTYDEVGDDSRDVVVFVHGHPFDRLMWAPQLANRRGTLAHWRLLAPDLRGYGDSAAPADKTTLDVFARDLVALLDQRGIERAVFAGLSMGGQIVMEVCRQFPSRVRGIVLAATFARAETPDGVRARHAMADRLLRDGMAAVADELLPRMLGARSLVDLPEVAQHVLTMMRSAPPAGCAAALRGRAERPSYDAALAGLAAPALIVVGDEDSYTTRDDADHLHRLIADAELVWLAGAGHMPNLERRDAFDAALGRFLARVTSER